MPRRGGMRSATKVARCVAGRWPTGLEAILGIRMRLIARLLLCLALAACSHSTFTCPDGAIPDGSACARCEVARPSSCNPGLVCCGTCHGIPDPPDFGPEIGNCTSNCPEQVCP